MLATAALLGAPVRAALWVSPGGDDANPGTEEQPLRTLVHARDVVRTMNRDMSDDITVFISGEHHVGTPIVLGPEDSGSNGFSVVYTAAPGEHPLITGGYRVAGWSLADKGRNLWSAPAPAGLENTFALFVNGNLANRTRGRLLQFFTKGPASETASAPDATAQWRNPQDVVFQRPGAGSIWSERSKGAPPFVENAFELLGMPGEWYFDRPARLLYYTPRIGEEMATAEVVAPSTGALLVGSGTAGHPLSGIIIKGIRFAHTTVPSPLDASPDGSAARPAPPAAVSLSHASGVQLLEDEFVDMSTPALLIGPGAADCVVDGCAFGEISWSGLRVEGASGVRVSECRFTYVCLEHHGAGAISVEGSREVTVEHNQIDHFPDVAVSQKGENPGDVSLSANRILAPLVSYHGSRPPEGAHPAGEGLPDAYQALADARYASLTMPRPPTRVAAEPEDGFAYVTWIPSCQDGGAPVTYYTVSASTGAVKVVPAEEFLARGYVVFGELENGHGVTFAVSAANRIGSSRPSPPTANVTPAHKRRLRPPEPPAIVSLRAGDQGAVVEVTPASGDGGSPVVAYALTLGAGGRRILLEGLDVVHSDVANPVSRQIGDWTPSPSETLTAASVNAAGESEPRAAASPR